MVGMAPAAARTMTDIFDRIQSEHDKHRTLLDIIARTHGDSAGRRELFAKLADEVRAHARAEERTFYAELLAAPESRSQAGHSVKEHRDTEDMIEELLEKDYGDSGWLTRFEVLADDLRHHMDEEEREVFPLAGRVLTEERKRELADEFERAKGEETRRVA